MDSGKMAAWLAFTALVVLVSPPRKQGPAEPAEAPVVQPAHGGEMRAECWPRHGPGEQRVISAWTWREPEWNWMRGRRRSGC